MKLKGIAKLTIKNEDGSIAFQEEHSNAITPALAKIFNHNLAGTVDYRKITPILNKLLGGVCLWDGTLNENSIYLPKRTEATLVAHAGQNVYASASADATRGNPNDEAEGYGPVENGFCFVWEWGTTQGAGQITGLTLCHADIGDYYNQLDLDTMQDLAPVEDISNYSLNANDIEYSDVSPSAANLTQVVVFNKFDKIPLGFYGDINRVMSIELEETSSGGGYGGGEWRSGRVNIYISKFTGDELWLWNSPGDLVPEEEKTLHITLPHWQWANFSRLGRCIYDVAYDETNKHLYFMTLGERSYYDWEQMPSGDFNYSWFPFSNTLWIIDIDLEAGTKQTREAELPLIDGGASYVFRAHEEPYEPRQFHIVNGCVYLPIYTCNWKTVQRFNPQTQQWYDVRYPNYEDVPLYSAGGAKVNLRTGAIAEYFTGPFATEGENSRSFIASLDLGNERAMGPDFMTERQSPNLHNRSLTRDTQLFGSNWRFNRLYVASTASSLIQYATLYKGAGGGDRIRGAILNKMYQASVFRLTRAVTKTLTQTMTVEYTILQTEEET